MGENIGTTITNTLVSLGHARRSEEFRRAFSAATMHDFFNIMAVAIFFPLELATGFMTRMAEALAGLRDAWTAYDAGPWSALDGTRRSADGLRRQVRSSLDELNLQYGISAS